MKRSAPEPEASGGDESPPAGPGAAALWEAELADALGQPVHVSFGRARRDVLVARRGDGGLRLRLAAGFAAAPADVRAAVAGWLRSGRRARRATARLDAFVAELANAQPPPAARRVPLRPTGAHHDLLELLPEALEALPAGLLPPDRVPPVTFGRRGKSPARRGLRLGSYDPATHLVRIHAVLDQPAVPAWFVGAVLHHELLHAALPSRLDGRGRHVHHSPEFRRHERAHRDYERAAAWEEEHLAALIRSARSGRPMRVPRAVQRSEAQKGSGTRERSAPVNRTGWLFPELGDPPAVRRREGAGQ